METEKSSFFFKFRAENAKKVALAGDFNNWDPDTDPLKKAGGGTWELKKEFVLPGKYLYKFVIDGSSWQHDPENTEKEPS